MNNPAVPVVDRVELMDRVGSSTEFLQEISALFLEEYVSTWDAIQKAVRDKDAVMLARAAHTLKGSVSNFAAHAAQNAARQLEIIGISGDLSEIDEAMEHLKREMERLMPLLEKMKKGEF